MRSSRIPKAAISSWTVTTARKNPTKGAMRLALLLSCFRSALHAAVIKVKRLTSLHCIMQFVGKHAKPPQRLKYFNIGTDNSIR